MTSANMQQFDLRVVWSLCPFIVYSCMDVEVCGVYSSSEWAGGQSTPWTGLRSVTGLFASS